MSATPAEPPFARPRRLTALPAWGWVLVALIAAVALAAAGKLVYQAGQRSGRTVTVLTGTAYRSGDIAVLRSDGWMYHIPEGIDWYQSNGEGVSGTRWPSCVKNGDSKIKFGSVSYDSSAYGSGRTVVWIQC